MDEDKYNEYPLESSLTGDDDYENYENDYPLVRSEYEFESEDDDEAPLDIISNDLSENTRKVRSLSRRETIEKIAKEQEEGILRQPSSRIELDPRIAASRLGKLGDSYTKKTPGKRRPTNGSDDLNSTKQNKLDSHSKYKQRKTMFAAFYIVLTLMAVGVCLTVFAIVFQNIMDNPPVIGGVPTPSPTPEFSTTNRPNMQQQTALITGSSSINNVRTLTLMDTSNARSEEFTLSESARLSNRFDMPITFAELRVGHIVDISFDAQNNEISVLNFSVHSREISSRTNVEIDMDRRLITVGAETFNWNSQTLILHRGEPFPITSIRPEDSVTTAVIGDTAWLIQVDAGHGFLELVNTERVINGTIMIGTNLMLTIDEVVEKETPLVISEGTHRVIIEGDNIESFIDNITVEQGQITTINLADIDFRMALFNIVTVPIDADIFINGELHDRNDGVPQLEFGEHHIRVEREGFIPQEQTIEIIRLVDTITFTLDEIVIESFIIINTVPSYAQIFIDNVFAGTSPLTQSVASGNIRITARMEGYDDRSIEFTVAPGEEATRFIILDPLNLLPPTPPPITDLPDVDPFPEDTQPPELPTLPDEYEEILLQQETPNDSNLPDIEDEDDPFGGG